MANDIEKIFLGLKAAQAEPKPVRKKSAKKPRTKKNGTVSKRGIKNEGRPRITFTQEQLKHAEELISFGVSASGVALALRCDKRTVERRFAALLEKGREMGGHRLLVDLFNQSREGKTAASIFLATQARYGLGFVNRYRSEMTGADGGPVDFSWADGVRRALKSGNNSGTREGTD